MRVDLFLKKCCVVRHRTLAKSACQRGRVLVDGVEAKPGKELHVGSTIAVDLVDRRIEVEVLAIPHGNVSKAGASRYCRILSEEIKSPHDL